MNIQIRDLSSTVADSESNIAKAFSPAEEQAFKTAGLDNNRRESDFVPYHKVQRPPCHGEAMPVRIRGANVIRWLVDGAFQNAE